MIVALVACARTVSVVVGDPGEMWSPDTGGAPSAPVPTADRTCGAGADLGGGDALALDWCVRVSPEPDQSWPGSGARCGFFNLTGAFGASGVDAPTVLYCDSDLEGGLRLGTYDAAAGAFSSQLVRPGGCAASPGSGALVGLTDGEWLGALLAIDAGNAVETVRLWADGTVAAGPFPLDTPPVTRLALSRSMPRLAAYVDEAETLWALPLAEDASSAVGAPVRLATGALDLALADVGGEVAVATCGAVGRVDVRGLDPATGSERWFHSPIVSDCEGWRRVGLAGTADGTLAVAWLSADAEAVVSVVGPGREEVARIELGYAPSGGIGPQISAAEASFLVVAPNGTGVVVDTAGHEVARFRHAGIGAHEELFALGLDFDGHRASFAPAWGDLEFVGVHEYVYDVIELSAARVVR